MQSGLGKAKIKGLAVDQRTSTPNIYGLEQKMGDLLIAI